MSVIIRFLLSYRIFALMGYILAIQDFCFGIEKPKSFR